MYKKISLLLVVVFLLSGVAFAREAVILYDGAKNQSEGYTSARFLYNLLGHFHFDRVQLVPLSEFRRATLKKKDLLFLTFEDIYSPLPPTFFTELAAFGGRVVWLNRRIQTMTDMAGKNLGFYFERFENRRDWKVWYRGEDFPKEDQPLNVMRIADPARAKVMAEAADGTGRRVPYIIRSGRFWYVADSPFSYADEGGRFLVLCDLLHEIVGENHPAGHRAMVRLEDVGPESDPKRFREACRYLEEQNVPVQISLIPVYKDPANQIEVYFNARPEMVQAIREAVDHGATVVMHGATHQYRGASGDDYEFWDEITGRPIRNESADWIDMRIRTAITECFRNGIYPVAWETPHYAASVETYRTVAHYFDTFFDRIMATEGNGTQQVIPFPVRLPDLGVTVVPENLGYIDINKPDPERIIQNANNTWMVRDATASFFFHHFVPLEHLKRVVTAMKKKGWTFVSLRDFPSSLRTDTQWVTTAGGQGKVILANQYLHEQWRDRDGEIKKETYSRTRQNGVVRRSIDLPKGFQYVLEAVDLLPVTPKVSLWSSIKNWIRKQFARPPEAVALRVSRMRVLFRHGVSEAEENDQQSLRSVLTIYGFHPEVWELGREKRFTVEGFDQLVVPQAAARHLMEIEENSIVAFVERGGQLILDGRSRLAEKVGIHFEDRSIPVRRVKDLTMPSQELIWKTEPAHHPFWADDAEPLAREETGGTPLAIVRKVGKGRILFFGPLFDPHTPFGLSRFPYVANYLRTALDIPFNVRRPHLEFYFDPGLRQGVSQEKMVKRWQHSGVKIVYAAAWHFYPRYQFDYRYFIDLCHRHGIAVYAWFEFPYVTKQMWLDHPEWREKTATLGDTYGSWRFPINFQHPEARAAALAFYRRVLLNFDWDGVNLAELNYDTDHGAGNPDRFTPMNPQVRAEFRRRTRVDPLQFFNPSSRQYWVRNPKEWEQFLRYRCEIVRDWHTMLLDELSRVRATTGREMESIVTVMDSLNHPELIEECGIDVRDVIPLMDQSPFTLQVEDPARSWGDPPDRYRRFMEAYRPLVRDLSRMMFDINVVSRPLPEESPFPSKTAVGTELAATFFYASLPSGRVGLYAESTVNPYDMDLLTFVLGGDVQLQPIRDGFSIKSRRPFTLNMVDSRFSPVLNGEDWPFYGPRGISIPSGERTLEFKRIGTFDLHPLANQITFDGDMYDLNLLGNLYSLRYDSPTPVALAFTRSLERVKIDGHTVEIPADRRETILPRGAHELEIFTESPPARAIDVVGYLSSTFFYLLGLLSVVSLLLMYLYSRVKR